MDFQYKQNIRSIAFAFVSAAIHEQNLNVHVAAITLAAIDVEKEQDKDGDGHSSKVIVIPFDGAALDRELQSPAT